MSSPQPRVIGIHQPNLLPWCDYFDKMDRCDVFVLLDAVQFTHQSLISRVKILQGGAPRYVSVPVRHLGTTDVQIRDVRIVHARRFVEKTVATLRQSYRRQPYWQDYGEPIVEILELKQEFLVDLNVALLKFLAGALGIPWAKVRMQSGLDSAGQKSELTATLTRAAGGTIYLSGGDDPGDVPPAEKTGTAADYNDPAVYASHGVTLRYQNFTHPVYDQQTPEFLPGLSVLDALVRLGDNAMEMIRACNRGDQ